MRRGEPDPAQWAEFIDVFDTHPPRVRDPWRDRWSDAFEVSHGLLCEVADDAQLRAAAGDTERLEMIRAQWQTEGIMDPLTVVLDAVGRVALKDGYHRLVVAAGWFERLPVRLVVSERIRMSSVPLVKVVGDVLADVGLNRKVTQ